MTGVSVDEYLSEKEQVEKLKQWWSENGRYVLAGIILGGAGLLGWNKWQDHKEARADAGSDTYIALVSALKGSESTVAMDLGQQLMDEYADTPYAAQGALLMARFHLTQAEPARAEELLSYVVSNAGDDELKHVARLRLSRVQMEQDNYTAALQTLAVDEAGSFVARYHELRGDAQLGLGKPAAAREEYTRALDSSQAGEINVELVRIKLDSVPAAAAADTTVDTTETS